MTETPDAEIQVEVISTGGAGVRPSGPRFGVLELPTAVLAAGQIAQFEFDQAGRPYYLIAVRDVTVDGEVTITLRGDMRVIDQIFGDRYGLGQSGETWPRELRVVLNWFEELRQRAPAARWHKPLTRFALCDHRSGVRQAR